jgi:6-phosphofructokinase 1
MLTKMFQEEGGKLFDARCASLGHTLQGGVPSPIDRARAVRLSLKCMAFVEEHHEILSKQAKTRCAEPASAAVITIQSSSIKWVPVREMVQHADMANRRGKSAWWHDVALLVEELAGKPQFLGVPRSEWQSCRLEGSKT